MSNEQRGMSNVQIRKVPVLNNRTGTKNCGIVEGNKKGKNRYENLSAQIKYAKAYFICFAVGETRLTEQKIVFLRTSVPHKRRGKT
jgi:hypothetical protein